MTDTSMKTAAPTLPTTPPLVILKYDAVARSCVTAKFLKKDYASEKAPSKSKSPLKSKAAKPQPEKDSQHPTSTTESVSATSKASRSRTPRRSKRISKLAAKAVGTLSSNTRDLVLNALRNK